MSFQRVIIEGLIGNKYELREFGESGKVIDFSIATQEYDFRSKENKTIWHHLTAFGKNASFINDNIEKGSSILIEGRLSYEEYETNGQQKQKTKILVDSIHFSGRKENGK